MTGLAPDEWIAGREDRRHRCGLPAQPVRAFKPFRFWFRLTLLGLVGFTVAGCHSLGPRTVPVDRFDYSAALADSWKREMLLNVVKTRYLDLPGFLEVGQFVSGYTLATSGNLGGTLGTLSVVGNSITLGGAATYSQQPTITYTPLTGDKFLQGFMSPVLPGRVFALVQSGYAADFVLQLSLESFNGLRNQPISLGSKYKADPEFFRVLKLLREIQDARVVGMKVEQATNGAPATVLFFRSDRADPEILAKIAEMRSLLGLTPGVTSFRLVQTPLRGGKDELGVDTRTLWQIMGSLSMGVDVPEKHRKRNLTPPMPAPLEPEQLLLRIRSGDSKPKGAFVAVPYEGAWFWIDNDDWKSKRTFTSILFLFTLADTGNEKAVPTLTIPTR